LYGRIAAFFPIPLCMAEIPSEPQHPGFRETYRFLEEEHINIWLVCLLTGCAGFAWLVALSVLACFEDVDFPHWPYLILGSCLQCVMS